MTDMNGNTQEEPPVIYNISKHKDEENLESSKRRKTSHTGIPTQDFSLETSEARRQWVDTSKVLKEKKNCQSRILYLGKLSFENEGGIKIFPDKQKLRVHHHWISPTRNIKGSPSG